MQIQTHITHRVRRRGRRRILSIFCHLMAEATMYNFSSPPYPSFILLISPLLPIFAVFFLKVSHLIIYWSTNAFLLSPFIYDSRKSLLTQQKLFFFKSNIELGYEFHHQRVRVLLSLGIYSRVFIKKGQLFKQVDLRNVKPFIRFKFEMFNGRESNKMLKRCLNSTDNYSNYSL